jgi:UDP-N-acetylglucosamine pyrophosphorylase
MNDLSSAERKMLDHGLGDAAIRAFARARAVHLSGASSLLAESDIEPATGLADSATLDAPSAGADLIARTVVIKLNGGLGTSMGLEKAKSLLVVKQGHSFLDLIARQILHQREAAPTLRFLLMNSFSTSDDTRAALARHPGLGDPAALEMLQNRVPKLRADNGEPVEWPANPALEWCPPGHGDIYAALLGGGWLDRLLGDGVLYAFISNSDNLGATLDPKLLGHFAASGAPFLMEVTRRTEADKKGGHLAVRKIDRRLVLRESAQCPKADEAAFQDISRHRYFNTNNLWLRLDRLKEALDEAGGLLPLPIMRNHKTVDPRDPQSPAVVQLETAMGAAIECFAGAAAIEVPRTRFAPVKTTADLLVLRSDACVLTSDWRVELHPDRAGVPPLLDLDPKDTKLVDGLETVFGGGAPSLLACDRLLTRGPMIIPPGAAFAGEVEIHNHSAERISLPARLYEDESVPLAP